MGDASETQLGAILEEIRSTRQEVNNKLDELNNKFGPVRQTLKIHDTEIKDLKKEKYRKRLIIFGLSSSPNEPREELESKLLRLFKDNLNMSDFTLAEVDFCKRLGARSSTNKPIQLGLTTERRKHLILKSSKFLKDIHISIREDLPPEVRAVRAGLLSKMRQLRAEGKYATVRYDQLIVHGDRSDNIARQSAGQKRAYSQSPGGDLRQNKKATRNGESFEQEDLMESFSSLNASMQDDTNTGGGTSDIQRSTSLAEETTENANGSKNC